MNISFSFGEYSVEIKLDPHGGGTIKTNLKDEEAANDGDDDAIEYNRAIDGLESLVLAHACAGVAVTDPKYVEGIAVAVDAIFNNTAG